MSRGVSNMPRSPCPHYFILLMLSSMLTLTISEWLCDRLQMNLSFTILRTMFKDVSVISKPPNNQKATLVSLPGFCLFTTWFVPETYYYLPLATAYLWVSHAWGVRVRPWIMLSQCLILTNDIPWQKLVLYCCNVGYMMYPFLRGTVSATQTYIVFVPT